MGRVSSNRVGQRSRLEHRELYVAQLRNWARAGRERGGDWEAPRGRGSSDEFLQHCSRSVTVPRFGRKKGTMFAQRFVASQTLNRPRRADGLSMRSDSEFQVWRRPSHPTPNSESSYARFHVTVSQAPLMWAGIT